MSTESKKSLIEFKKHIDSQLAFWRKQDQKSGSTYREVEDNIIKYLSISVEITEFRKSVK